MGLHHRKLTQQDYCDGLCHNEFCDSESDSACKDCIKDCLSDLNPKHTKNSTYLIVSFSIVATAFFVLCCYAIYAKFFRNRRNRASPPRQQPREEETRDEFLDEEHGPMVDHPIWYIRTTGLHQSIINAIAVCKYKKGEGLVEGTECSVCLSEFQQDESLRLLPKCNHAFHLPCIDTWLRSHTNCPLCRAPIVTNPARLPSMDHNVFNSSSLEQEDQVQRLEDSGIEVNDGDHEPRNRSEEAETEGSGDGGTRLCENEVAVNVQPRRSVSLDSSSAAKISAAVVAAASAEDCRGNSKRLDASAKGSSSSSSRTRHAESGTGSMKRSRSFNGKHLMSWYSRGQKSKHNDPVRSF